MIAEDRGSKNWKNLFKKPTLQEVVIFIMLIMSLFLWWAYNQDMETCREVVAECNAYMNQELNPSEWWDDGNLTLNWTLPESTPLNLSEEVGNDSLE